MATYSTIKSGFKVDLFGTWPCRYAFTIMLVLLIPCWSDPVLAAHRPKPSTELPIIIPIRFVNSFPMFDGLVNGHELTLTFDLGSDSAFALTKEGLRIVNPVAISGTAKRSDVKGNVYVTSRFKIDSLKLGTRVFSKIEGNLDAHDPSYPGELGPEQGVVGEPLFKPYRLVLDYINHRIVLIPKSRKDPEKDGCSGHVVPFIAEWGNEPVTKFRTDLGDIVVTWDTGARMSIIRKALTNNAAVTVIDKFYASGKSVLNGRDFGPTRLRVLDFSEPPGIDGIIGNDFLAKHVVCIDYPNNRLLIQ